MSWPKLERRKAALVAARDLRDAISELRLIAAMVALTLAIPIGAGSGVRALAAFGGGTAVVNRPRPIRGKGATSKHRKSIVTVREHYLGVGAGRLSQSDHV